MKRILALFFLAFLGTHIMAEELNINGTVLDYEGNVVVGHEVYLTVNDSAVGFNYSNTVYTDESGNFSDIVAIGDVTQGEVFATTQSCNEMVTATAFFNPGNYEINFVFEVCTDTTGGGGNDTIPEGCNNYFYYYQDGLEVSFFGGIENEGDATYTWSFGDGTAGDGMEVIHTYGSEGTYQVSLTTVLNDTCESVSYQTIILVQDTSGGGNDTIPQGCENYFYAYQEGLDVVFYGEVYAQGDVEYSWNFGDGATGEGQEVTHAYSEEGAYDVILETVLNDTCTAISYQTIYVTLDSTGGGNDSTNCQNDFVYEVYGMMVDVEGWVEQANTVTEYAWSFGDGSSASGQYATHEYAQAGDYMITLTTMDMDSCVAVTSKWVSISGGAGDAFLYGQVSVGDNYLDYGIVKLYAVMSDTVGANDIELVATTMIDSSGAYYFNQVALGSYLILVEADQTSMYFENAIPTYFGDVIFWTEATIVVLGEPANPYNIQMQMAQGTNSGEGIINGDLIGGDFKSQLNESDIRLFLLDENNNPLEITYSEANNSFDFSNIAFGSYVVYAEITGLPTEPAIVTLDADNPTAIVAVYLDPNGVTTGLEDMADMQISNNLYPNPVQTHASLDINTITAKQVDMLILNQLGQVVYSATEYLNQGNNRLEINTSDLKTGMYILQITSDLSTVSQKFIKK